MAPDLGDTEWGTIVKDWLRVEDRSSLAIVVLFKLSLFDLRRELSG